MNYDTVVLITYGNCKGFRVFKAFLPQSDVSEEDLQRRKEYLKQQRDRLLALKRQERENQLKQFERTTASGRPKSSIAANRVRLGRLDQFLETNSWRLHSNYQKLAPLNQKI